MESRAHGTQTLEIVGGRAAPFLVLISALIREEVRKALKPAVGVVVAETDNLSVRAQVGDDQG